jgi:glycosyltransferase involved in cell wall biosynthesis
MASGKPVVGVDAGALGELCQDNVNGYLCAKDDIEGFSEALLELVNNEKKRAKFSAASLAIAKTHDIAHTLDKFESIYGQVITAKTRRLPQRLL